MGNSLFGKLYHLQILKEKSQNLLKQSSLICQVNEPKHEMLNTFLIKPNMQLYIGPLSILSIFESKDISLKLEHCNLETFLQKY